MEKSNTENFLENVTPSAPTFNGSHHEDFTDHSLDGIQPAFINNGFQDDFTGKSVPPLNQPINTRFMPHQPDTNDSYCDRLLKNFRQASSVSGGLLLLINSGLHIGWGIWRTMYYGLWIWYVSLSLFIFMLMAWSVGAFIGGFAGSILTPILRKKTIYLLSGAIMVVGNVLFIALERYGEAIAAGRVLMGLAHGMAYVTLITHAGENAAKNMRATILSIVNCMLYTGIFVSVVITGTVQYDWWGNPITLSSDRIVGIVGAALAVVSICLTTIVTIESVPFLLHQNNHQNAMKNLKRLRGSTHETLALTQENEEFHLMIVQDKQDNWNIFTGGNGRPLVLMILMRLMVALTNNFLMNTVAFVFVFPFEYRFVPLVYVAPRLGMSILQIFYADIFKRKVQLIVSSLLASIALIVAGIILNTVQLLWTPLVAMGSLLIFFQFACSIGMDQMQDVYLSEAFSTAKKRWSLPFVVGIEHMFHIFMIGMYFVIFDGFQQPSFTDVANPVVFVTASVVLLLGISFVFLMPETRKMSLKQARDAFLNYSVNLKSPFE